MLYPQLPHTHEYGTERHIFGKFKLKKIKLSDPGFEPATTLCNVLPLPTRPQRHTIPMDVKLNFQSPWECNSSNSFLPWAYVIVLLRYELACNTDQLASNDELWACDCDVWASICTPCLYPKFGPKYAIFDVFYFHGVIPPHQLYPHCKTIV